VWAPAHCQPRTQRSRLYAGAARGRAGAEETTARWIAHYPLNEAAHRLLMRIRLAAGDHPAALRAYEACCALLDAELGAAPSQETEALAAQICLGRPAGATPPSPAAMGGRREGQSISYPSVLCIQRKIPLAPQSNRRIQLTGGFLRFLNNHHCPFRTAALHPPHAL
jgi:hypothetical protein